MNAFLYGLRQKLIVPARRWFWRRKSQPFVFSAGSDRAMRLVPGEYIDEEIFVHGAYEYRLLKLIREKLRGGTYVDVGANIGNHALYLASNFDRVICFEPNPPIVARLRENIALSGRSNIVVHEVGLGDEVGELPFHHNNCGNAGGGTFLDADCPVSDTLLIRVGDEMLEKCGPIALIKVDVEGFEPFVFRGLRRTIAKHRPMVIFEHDGRIPDFGRWQQIVDCLPGYRFAELTGIAGSGVGKLVSALRNGVETRLLEVARPTQKFYETIIAFPSDEAAAAFGIEAKAPS